MIKKHPPWMLLFWSFLSAIAAEITIVFRAAATGPRPARIWFSAIAAEIACVLCTAAAHPSRGCRLRLLILKQRIIFLRLHILEHC